MQIVRIIATLEPGGAQLSALRLSGALRAHDMGSVRLLAGDTTPEGLALAEHHGISVETFRLDSGISSSASLQWTPSQPFADWLAPRLAGADLVHAHMFGAWWAASQVLPPGVALVASEHNEMTWPGPDRTSAARAVAPRVAAFFGHGPAATAFARIIGIPAALTHEGRSAIVASTAEPWPGLPRPRITFAGRFREDKGPDLLIEAVARLADPPPTYLVGDGPMRARLQALARRSGIADLVRMPGWSMLPERWVAGASVHVVPSREEAWSQSAVMGLALGVPVIGTRVDGLALTLSGDRGVLVPPAKPDALATAIADVLSGRRLDPAPGCHYAAQFTPAAVATYYARIYQSLLERATASTSI